MDQVFFTTHPPYAYGYATAAKSKHHQEGIDSTRVILKLKIPYYMLTEFRNLLLNTGQETYNEFNKPELISHIIDTGVREGKDVEQITVDLVHKSHKSARDVLFKANEFTVEGRIPVIHIEDVITEDWDQQQGGMADIIGQHGRDVPYIDLYEISSVPKNVALENIGMYLGKLSDSLLDKYDSDSFDVNDAHQFVTDLSQMPDVLRRTDAVQDFASSCEEFVEWAIENGPDNQQWRAVKDTLSGYVLNYNDKSMRVDVESLYQFMLKDRSLIDYLSNFLQKIALNKMG